MSLVVPSRRPKGLTFPEERRSSMKLRFVRGVALAAALAVAVTAGPAFARSSTVPVTFKEGKAFPFGGPGATRFDGQLYKTTNRIYFLGFRQLDNSTSGEVWYYDLTLKKYKDAGVAMPVAVSNYQIAALTDASGKLGFYIFGGRTDDNGGTIVTAVQAYFPASKTTKLFNGDPWPGTTPSACVSLPAMGVAVFNNKAIVMGGVSFSANGCVDDQSAQTWIFSPKAANGSKWTAGTNLNVARGYITPAVLGNKVYAIGGDINNAGTLIAQKTVEAAKKGTASWNDSGVFGVKDLPEPCDESQAFARSRGPLANTITLAGCGQWPNDSADVNQYDATTNSWSLAGALNEARRNQAGAAVGKNMYVFGGYGADGATALASSEIGKAAPFAGARASHASSEASQRATTS